MAFWRFHFTIREPDKHLDQLAHTVIGAAIEVYRTIGPGYGELVGEGYIDIFVERRLIVELKAVESLLPVHTAQVISYLKATRCLLALLINFNVPVLKTGIRRIVLS